jgi:hypothetical protein
VLFGHRAGKNLLIVELGLHHIRLLVGSPSAITKLPSRRAISLRCAAYLVTVLVHLKNVAYVVSLGVIFPGTGKLPDRWIAFRERM